MRSYIVTIQMKTIEQYFPVVPFTLLYEVALTFDSVDEILYLFVTIRMKTIFDQLSRCGNFFVTLRMQGGQFKFFSPGV